MIIVRKLIYSILFILFSHFVYAQHTSFRPGELWMDTDGIHINAHGGGILIHEDTYYWFGEHKDEKSNNALVGITCYASTDLYNWENKGVALSVDPDGSGSEIEYGCIMERPKVIYNNSTGKFIMYFHLELKGEGYEAARVGIAVADEVSGPYTYLKSLRPNAGQLPLSYERSESLYYNIYFLRDYENGNKSRDMTLFVDDDQVAYHIFSSEDNATLHIAELTQDYLDYTGVYERMSPGGYNEAPAIFKRGDKYFMITSGCTGWDPNEARMFAANHIMGPWIQYPNPCIGKDADLTFRSQSTYVVPLIGKEDTYIFMADRWKPGNPINGTYVWLPIQFENGLPILEWADEWTLDVFTTTFKDLQQDILVGKEWLSSLSVGTEIGNYPVEAYQLFEEAISEAERIEETASEKEMAEAILQLSNAATELQNSKIAYKINEIEEGAYYIKVNNRLYLTNSEEIGNDQKIGLQTTKNETDNSQVFLLTKDELTGRYKIESKLDNRNINENCNIRSDWGQRDHLFRTMHFHFDGTAYAIQNDGNSAYGGFWQYNGTKHQIEPSGVSWLTSGADDYFIFSLEKAPDITGILHLANSSVDFKIVSGGVWLETDEYAKVYIYDVSGVEVKHSEIVSSSFIPLSQGIYILKIISHADELTQKVIIK